MEDIKIVDLFWRRSESAIEETDRKYGAYCRAISYGILQNREDSEECVNDTYLALWNNLPPQRPTQLRAYLGRVSQNLSLRRVRASLTQKRGCGEIALAYDELEDCVAGPARVEGEYELKELANQIDAFLRTLPTDERKMFMYRYWLAWPVADIAKKLGFKESRVVSSLYRSRQKLRRYLIKEGLL